MGSVAEPWENQDENRYNPLARQDQFLELLRGVGARVLESDEGNRIVRFKRDLILELFLRQGDFWDEIKAMRERWHISASTQLVETDVWCPYPEDPEYWDPKIRRQWSRDVRGLVGRVIPSRYLSVDIWQRFLSACILYNPPESHLIDFANFSNPGPTTPLPVSVEEQEAMGDSEHLSMIAPPIRSLPGPDNTPKLYIEVNPWTTEHDVRNAFRLIRQTQPDQQKDGAPGRDRLAAVQCAVLYDRYNSTGSADKRRRKWTHKRLAEKFGLKSARVAKEYVDIGRVILAKTRLQ